MQQKYFVKPFAFSGDTTVVPNDAQPSGAISFAQGWGFDYQRDQATDPLAKPIDRMETNYLFSVITENLKQYQERGFPEFITPANNNGVPYPYAKGAVVLWSASGAPPFTTYVSLIDNNTDAPSVAAKWKVIDFAAPAVNIPMATPGTQLQSGTTAGIVYLAGNYNTTDINVAATPGNIQSTVLAGKNAGWKDMTSQRAANTTYYNQSYRPIAIAVLCTVPNATNYLDVDMLIDGNRMTTIVNASSITWGTLQGVIPIGSSYRVEPVSSGSQISKWYELRD